MANKVYVFNNSEKDNAEAAKHFYMAVGKEHAFKETVRFIFDGCRGLSPEIREDTLNDAFDCIINLEKSKLYLQELSKSERERRATSIELDYKARKEWFKTSMLKVKDNT